MATKPKKPKKKTPAKKPTKKPVAKKPVAKKKPVPKKKPAPTKKPAPRTKRATSAKPQPLRYKPAKTGSATFVQRPERAFAIVYEPTNLRPLAAPKATLSGHSQFVQGLAFSPDSKRLVTSSEDGTIRVWDLTDPANPICAKVANDHGIAVNCVSFTADGSYLLSSADDRTVKVWSVPDFEVVRTLEGHTDYVSRVFPAGPGRAVSCGKDGTIRHWDLATGECLRVMEEGGWVTCLAASRDGKHAITANDRNLMRIWDLTTGASERVLVDASGDYIGDVMGYTLASENDSGVGHRNAPKSIVMGPDDTTFLSSEDNVIEWDTATGAEHGRIDGDGWPISGIAFIPDRATTLRAHADATERSFIEQLEKSPDDRAVRTVYGDWLEERGRLAEANSVRRHGAFRYIFAGTNDAVHVLDLGLHAIVAQAAWGHGDVHNVAVSPDGRWAASGSHEGKVGLWSLDELLAAGMPDRHLSRLRETAINIDGIALTATTDRTARLWTATGTKNERLPPFPGLFAKVAFTPDGRLALVLTDGGSLLAFDGKTAEFRATATFEEGRHHPFNVYTFLRDGRLLAASTSGPLSIWPLDPPADPIKFEVDAKHVTALAVDEDLDLVVTAEYASSDEPMAIKLWSLANRALVREVAFRPAVTQYAAGLAIVDVGEPRIVLTTSEGGVVVIDLEGTVQHAVKLRDGYLNSVLALPGGKVVIAGDPPCVFDAATARATTVTLAEAGSLEFLPGTTRAIVRSPAGMSLADFATHEQWQPVPVQAWAATASPNAEYVLATPESEHVAGAPIVLRRLQ